MESLQFETFLYFYQSSFPHIPITYPAGPTYNKEYMQFPIAKNEVEKLEPKLESLELS